MPQRGVGFRQGAKCAICNQRADAVHSASTYEDHTVPSHEHHFALPLDHLVYMEGAETRTSQYALITRAQLGWRVV